MKVLYKWKECFRFDDHADAYYLEIHKSEISEKLLSLLENDKNKTPLDERYYEDVNRWVTSNKKWKLANRDCIYTLVDNEVTTAILCAVYYPYSGQWNGYCPFQYLYSTNNEVDEYLKNAIEISDLYDIKKIDEIIVLKGFNIR